MKNKNILIYSIFGILLFGILLAICFISFYNPWGINEEDTIKILYLNSYHKDFDWANEQYQGFKDFLDSNNINYEMDTFEMDTKNKNSEEDKQAAGKKAIKFIEEFGPDLVYATDDNAQKYVGTHYINSNTLWIFSGVNGEPEQYGYDKAKNVAGFLERELFIEGIDLLQTINPSIHKIGIISDDSETSVLIMKYLNDSLNDKKLDIETIEWYAADTFENYKNKILEYNEKADAIFLLTTYTIKDANGKIVPPEEIIRWTVENSHVPEISSSHTDVEYGALLAVETTGHQTGYEAGKISIQILEDGASPQNIGIHIPKKHQKFINYARAQKLKLKIPSDILISSEVTKKFLW